MLRQPLREQILREKQRVLRTLSDIDFLLENYPEEEVKDIIILLSELNEVYCANLKKLTQQLKAQKGYDFEVSYKPFKD